MKVIRHCLGELAKIVKSCLCNCVQSSRPFCGLGRIGHVNRELLTDLSISTSAKLSLGAVADPAWWAQPA